MLDRSQITAVHWQAKRTPEGAVLGAIASELDDLAQEIRQCILTPKRSVPLNPEKGCDLLQFRDRPLDARQLLIAAEVRDALTRWVPRIVVLAIEQVSSFDAVTIKIDWQPIESVSDSFVTTEVDYVL